VTVEEKIQKYYGNLKKIVEQLEMCNFVSERGVLVNNAAFIALKKMSEEEN